MKKFYKQFIIFIFSVSFLAVISPFSVYASEIIFQSPSQSLGVGDQFSVPIVLSSDGEDLNAISGDVTWNDDTLSAVNVLSANSIVSSWIEAPQISGNSVSFSGIMPGGYQSVFDPVLQKDNPGLVATIIFQVKKAGVGKIEFTDAHLFENDGLGTEASVQDNPLTVSFGALGSGLTVSTINDTNPPEAFTPILANDPNIYNGKTVVIFSTADKETGIDHYEVKEGNSDWIQAESPFLLPDQRFHGTVYVKAVDLAGNYRIGRVELTQKTPAWIFFVPVLIILLIIIFFRMMFLRHVHRKKIFLGSLKSK
jgi:hypothetical protein